MFLSVNIICLLFAGLVQIYSQEARIIIQPLKSTYNGNLFYVPIGVGGDDKPRQTFNLLVSTIYDVTWIPSREVSRDRGYQNTTSDLFSDKRHLLSTTGAGFGGYYIYIHNNSMFVGSQPVGRQQFALAYRPGYYFDFYRRSKLDGMLGLSGYDSRPEGVDYLFKKMRQMRYIDRLEFSLYMNNSATSGECNDDDDDDNDDRPKGALVLGGVDQRYYTGEFQFAPMEEDPDRRRNIWFDPELPSRTLFIYGIYLDWSRVSQDEDQRARETPQIPATMRQGLINLWAARTKLRLDSTAILNVGDKMILEQIHKGFIGGKNLLDKEVFMFNNCQLDNKPDLVFALNGMNLTVTPADYVIEHQLNGRRVCLSAFRAYHEGIWVLGTKFMRKYYTLFDYENHRVGFATPT